MTYAVSPAIKSQGSHFNLIICGEFIDTATNINSEGRREEILKYYMEPISRQEANPMIRFLRLKNLWEEETAMLSSVTEISMNHAYQQIIGMGQDAVPLILSELRKKPGHWFWALKSITGEDPVLQKQRGKLKEMTEAWLKWGKEKGYIVQ